MDMKFMTPDEIAKIPLQPGESIALEVKGDCVTIKIEREKPSVRIGRAVFYVDEPPSLVVGGVKHYVCGIA